MRKALILFVVFAASGGLFSPAVADEGSSSAALVLNNGLGGASYEWLNDALNINWDNPEVDKSYNVEYFFVFSEGSRGMFGIVVERLDYTSDPWQPGEVSTLHRKGRQWFYGGIAVYELTNKRVRPFVGTSFGLMTDQRFYEEHSTNGTLLDEYKKDRNVGVFLHARAGANVYFGPVFVGTYLEYYDLKTLPRVVLGGGFRF